MPKKTSYVFAIVSDRPDFIGEFVGISDGFLVLGNPMVVEYRKDFTAAFSADFLPVGMPPRYDRMLRVSIPTERLLYFVTLDPDDIMVKGYLEELNMTPEKAAAG